jgi:hypothetical protein
MNSQYTMAIATPIIMAVVPPITMPRTSGINTRRANAMNISQRPRLETSASPHELLRTVALLLIAFNGPSCSNAIIGTTK